MEVRLLSRKLKAPFRLINGSEPPKTRAAGFLNDMKPCRMQVSHEDALTRAQLMLLTVETGTLSTSLSNAFHSNCATTALCDHMVI